MLEVEESAKKEIGLLGNLWIDWYVTISELATAFSNNSKLGDLIGNVFAPGGLALLDRRDNIRDNRLND